MSLFPIFVKLAGRPALVVGGGAPAESRIEALLASGALVQVVARTGGSKLREWAGSGAVVWCRREFRPGDVAGRTMVFAATGVAAIDGLVFAACRRWGVLCNAVDDPPHCDFYCAAVVRRGDLQIAISTNGQSPALAQQLRRELEQRFDGEWSQRLEALGRERREILARVPAGPERVRLLHEKVREALAEAAARTEGDRVIR